MKTLFFVCLLGFISTTTFAKVVKPTLDEVERFEYSEFKGERAREVAGEKVKKEKKEREPSATKIEEQVEEPKIKYWSY